MSLLRLALLEIRHRRLNFLLGLLSVTVAVACLVGAQTILQADRVITENLLNEREAEVTAAIAEKAEAVASAGAELEDAMRKHMLGLGFNILILPESQPLSEMHLDGTLTATMPEQYVQTLADSSIVTVNHLLPSVTRRIRWPEQDRDIILIGTRGEVPIKERALKKPMLDEVAPGKMVVGHEIHTSLGLSEGDVVTLMAKEFTVSTLHPERGSTDDVTVWINLAEAQELLGMQNLINAILALECKCEGDRIAVIRQEIEGILPGTKVVERYSQALARAEARTKAKEAAESALQQEQKAGEELLASEASARRDIEDRHAGLAAVLVPLVILGSVMMIGLLAFANTRQRSEEVGILRAIGLKARHILLVFLTKAGILGLLGGISGAIIGLGMGYMTGGLPVGEDTWQRLFAGNDLLTTVALSPVLALLLSGIASWIPALQAARQDPAVVLQN